MIETIILKMAAKAQAVKAQAAKAQVVVILMLAPPPTTGGSTESIGTYKSEHVSRG